jgi:hypothetical protein
MRHSNHGHRARWWPATVVSVTALILAACGGNNAPSASASNQPAPLVTPDPHLKEPVSADQIFLAIGKGRGGLTLVAMNALAGTPGQPFIKRINAELANWPLIITQFRSGADLRNEVHWDATKPPAQGDPPYSWVGLNVLVQFGPSTGSTLAAPDATRQSQANTIVGVLDPLLWPLEQRAVIPIPSKTATPTSAPSVAVPASAAPAASPKPSKKP